MSYDDDTDFEIREDEAAPRRRLRPWVIPAAVVLLAGSAAIAWIIIARLGGDAPADGPVPLIEAESGPVKTPPEDEGGLEVPNQDKLVYDRLTGEGGEGGPEELLAEEAPVAEAASEGALEPTAEAASATPEAAVPVVEETPAAPSGDAATGAEQAEIPVGGETASVADAASAAVDDGLVAEPSAPVAEEMAAVSGDFRVQVASVRSAEAAEQEAMRLAKAQPDLLGGMSYDVERADLGDKGIYYRTRFGPLAKADADGLCAKLKERGLDCLVVK